VGLLTVILDDNQLWFAGIVAEVAIVALLIYRRVWRTLPVFCILCAWGLISDAGNYVVQKYFPQSYTTVYLIETIVDSALEFSVLVELAWSVLRPIRASLTRKALIVVAVLIVAAGAAVWPFSGILNLGKFPAVWQNLVHIQQTASFLRVLFFLVLAGCSQLLSIGWRDRELQVATGLGFYSIVSLAVTVLHSRQMLGDQYRHLNQLVAVSYILSIVYWVFAFATKEAERREFTPQMQSFLLAVAGTARTARITLAEPPTRIDRKPGKR
jgi:hypothetical protein